MRQFLAGAVSVLIGGALAFATASGVVNLVSETPQPTQLNVMDYGSTIDD